MLSDEEKKTLDTYNNIAGDWAAKNTDADFWADEHLKFSLIVSSGYIIDVGCGTGRDSQWFVDHGYGYVGVDASTQMIQIAQAAHPDYSYYVQNFYELGFKDASFDGFWAANSLLHVPKNKIYQPLAEINRVCKPGALGFIGMREGVGVGMVEWGTTGQDRYYAYYSTDEFRAILVKAGFEVLESGQKNSPVNAVDSFLTFFVRKV